MTRSNPPLSLGLVALLATACASVTLPGTDHSPNDGSVDNGDGTFDNTVANVAFTTITPDFSGEPVITRPTVVTGIEQDAYTLPGPPQDFRVRGEWLFGSVASSSVDTQLVVFDHASDEILSTHPPDIALSGFDYNGAILTSDGGTDLYFYRVDGDGVIADPFFQISDFQDSQNSSEVFLDHASAYVRVADRVVTFPLADSTDVTEVASIPASSELSFEADQTSIYMLVGGDTDSSLRLVDRVGFTTIREIPLTDVRGSGLAVDANYLYVADQANEEVLVWNKHNDAFVGSISVPDVGEIEVVDGLLYASNTDASQIVTYELVSSAAP